MRCPVALAVVLASCVRPPLVDPPHLEDLPPPRIERPPGPVAEPPAPEVWPRPPEQKPEKPARSAAAEPTAPSEPAPPARQGPDVASLLSRMTLEQKVGQLMMVGFGGLEVDENIEALVKGRQVGGVCMFKRNIQSIEQIARLNDQVRALLQGTIPPFIAVDQEGGNVVRIAQGAIVLPGNMALGATRSPELAYQAGRAQGEDLKLLGFNMNLAPVLDVNLNPRNPVIGIRSFGDRVDLVSRFGADFVRGQQDANIATVAKHFPGHGTTDADSHKALPVMKESQREVLEQMAPFEAAIEQGLDGLMTAHVAIPNLTGDDVPATLSKKILTGLLREKVGFDGLVLTDELEMEAIAERYGVGRAAVMAVLAGADMVLIPWRPEKKAEVHQALLQAARSGELSPKRLDEAVRRILEVKVRRGLFDEPPPLEERLARLGRKRSIAEQIARQSVTLLRSDGRHFPIQPGRKVAVVTAEAALGEAIRARVPNAQVLTVPAYASQSRRHELRQRAYHLAMQADVVVVGVINSRQVELVTAAASTGRPVLAVTLGLPYLAEHVHEAKAVLAVYSYREVSANAAAAALFGEQGTPGKLPVSLGRFPFGHGLDPVGEALAKKASSASGSR